MSGPMGKVGWVGPLALGVLAVVAVASGTKMLGARDEARYQAEDLGRARALVEAIEQLRGEPTVASAEESSGIRNLGERIGHASQQAAFDGPVLKRVDPQRAIRLGDTPYMVKPTLLVLRGVTLPQLTTFLYDLTDDSGLRVRDLRLRTPHGNAPEDRWDVDATVTYLIHSPVASN